MKQQEDFKDNFFPISGGIKNEKHRFLTQMKIRRARINGFELGAFITLLICYLIFSEEGKTTGQLNHISFKEDSGMTTPHRGNITGKIKASISISQEKKHFATLFGAFYGLSFSNICERAIGYYLENHYYDYIADKRDKEGGEYMSYENMVKNIAGKDIPPNVQLE